MEETQETRRIIMTTGEMWITLQTSYTFYINTNFSVNDCTMVTLDVTEVTSLESRVKVKEKSLYCFYSFFGKSEIISEWNHFKVK